MGFLYALKMLPHAPSPPYPCNTKHPETRSTILTWELVKNEDSQIQPQFAESESAFNITTQ